MLAVSACSLYGPETFLEVWMTVADTVAAPGGALDVEVRVMNYGLGEVRLHDAFCHPFTITDETGVVRTSTLTCISIATAVIELDRGESTVFSSQWRPRHMAGAPLPDGRYGLQSVIAPIRSDPVLSNLVPIRLVAAAAH